MSRYVRVPTIVSKENRKRRYINVKYPRIPPSPSDIYVYVGQGDRYDTLASAYYSNSSLWWIILRANPNQSFDTLFPSVGAQLRIPSPNRVSGIVVNYEQLNGF